MLSIRISIISWLTAVPLLVSGIASALDISINNPGFEDPVVAEGNYTQAPTGWIAYNGAVLGTDVYAYNPSPSSDFLLEAPEGQNIVGIYALATMGTEKGISQTLTTTFKEGANYELSFNIGYTAFYNGATGYRVQLLAGNTVIAEDDNSLSPGFGIFATKTISYVYDPILHVALINQPLQIRLINKNLTSDENEVAFDNLRLSSVLANPYADLGGPYYLANPLTSELILNAGASLPSGNETINSYQWDLNNDGSFDVTGVTPSAITYSTLQTTYGMVDGSNTIRLRVTDTSGKSTTALGNVEFVTSTKYTGPDNNRGDTWSSTSNWDNGIPDGVLDVVIPAGKSPMAWGNATPTFTGNLTLQNNAAVVIGWTTSLLGSYNAMGIPGRTKITMNAGSTIMTRMGGTPSFPEIKLLGNAVIILGTSTQGGATGNFNYPITGSYQMQFQGNNQGNCIANLNTSNSFNSVLASGSDPGVTIRANATGSLGDGNVTIAQRTGNAACYGALEINAINAMADTATLSFTGTTPILRMNANDTIAAFIINGVSQPVGTYGSTSSSATNKLSWITGTGILTVATPSVGYWDINGTTAGAGGISPSGTWNNSLTNWSTTAAGTGTVAAWTPGRTAIFSAGTDATGAYNVNVVGSQDISGIIIKSGAVGLNLGSGGALRLTADGYFSVTSGTSVIATPINQSSTRALTKSGPGTLVLSGNLSHTGITTLAGGKLTLSGSNSAAIGNIIINAGTLQVDSAAAIPGTTRNLTINSAGALVFGSSFGSSNIQTALNNRIVTTSAGIIAADNNPSADFNFSTASLSAAYFGAMSNVSYTGTLTPQGTTYRLSGFGGKLSMVNTNALTGGNALTVGGNVELAANNNYTGATTVETNGFLAILGSTTTSGITLNTGSTLTLGNDGSLGNGTLTLAGLTTLRAVGTVISTRPVAANSDFNLTGTGNLTLGATTINASRNITNFATGTTTFASITNGAPNLSLTVDGSGNTTVSGNLTITNGNLFKNGSGTLTLNGVNTYSITTLNAGTLRLNGSTSGAGTTTISAATLQLGSNANGGLSTGSLTISHPSAAIQAVAADRSISNIVILDNNLTFSGSNSLTINGKLTNNNADRTITNNVTSTKSLILSNVDLSQNSTNRILTIAGSGNTIIQGVIANGGGSTSSALIKNGNSTLTLNGSNTYSGATTVNAGNLYINGSMTGATSITVNNNSNLFINGTTATGNIAMNGTSNLYINGSTGSGTITMNGTTKLYVNNSTGTGNLTINSGATLLGAGVIGGNTTIANGGNLEFALSTAPAAHDKLDLAAGRSLTFSGSTQVTITGFASTGTYTLITAPGGIFGALPSLIYPDGWDASLAIVGNDLRLIVTYTGVFPNPPTLVSIADDKSGGPVDIYTPITYTVTFNEDINDTTVSSADFGNAGTSSITIGEITETTPGVFSIGVTPTTTGTLQLRINQGTNIRSTAGLNLNTTTALPDNNTLNIVLPANGVLTVTSGDFLTSRDPGGPFSPLSKTYTLTNYGNLPLDWTASKTAAWIDLSSPSSGTLSANGGTTTVTVSTNANASSLTQGSYFDTVIFTNITNNNGNTTRGVGLTVNGEPVQVILSNLNQVYNGSPKTVNVATDPTPITYSLTYNGLVDAPTNAGNYDIVATVTQSGYTGSDTATLVITKAPQTITFAALDPIGDDQTSFILTATSSSNLPITFTSSNTDVATVNGNVVTIISNGTTTITSSQAGDDNYEIAASVDRILTVTRSNPLAIPGGPYSVSSTQDLVLNGSSSLASNNQTITSYQWDLDDSNDGGNAFTANATGATPTAITMATLQSSYGMVIGSNPIRLRVTDSAGKTSTVSATVFINTSLRWDADATFANGQTDGSGGWLTANQWRDVAMGSNTTWTSGKDVIFGNNGTAGDIALPAPTSVGLITINNFSQTYDIGSAFELTINRGITKNAGTVNFACPIKLGADQTWINASGTLSFPAQLDLGAYNLTIDNTGAAQVNLSGQGVGLRAIGTGGIIKNGTGMLRFGNSSDHAYTGPTVVNNGILMLGNGQVLPGNIALSGGILQGYWGFGVTQTLGSGAGQIQLTGGTTGFSAITSNGAQLTFNGSANYEVVWGSDFFKPSILVLETGLTTQDTNFNNKLDLNGATRTVNTPVGPGGSTTATSTFSGIIRNSQATPAGLIKTGAGILRLNASNTYNGGTTLQAGTLQLGNVSGLGSIVGTLTVNAGLLNLNNMATVTVGNLTGTGGTIANNGNGASLFTIGNGGGTGGNFQGVIANRTSGTTGTVALTKTGAGAITLSGTNTYTGATNISQGKLFINGSNADSVVTVANGATLGGTGVIGGNVTVASGGKLEFNLSTIPGSHNPLDIATGKNLAFSGASELKINLSSGVTTGTYVLVTGGNNITGVAPATLTLPLGCNASVSIVGNQLRLVVTAIGDVTPPTLTNIADNQAGDSTILIDTLVTYTVTFNEDVDATTVTSADFTNAGTAAITFGTITETTPGVFTVQVTPTTTGTIQLRIPTSAVIQDISSNALVTSPAIDDNWTTTVTNVPYTAWSNAGSFNTDANGDGIPNGLAWLLGAANPNSNATSALPTAAQNSGNLTLTFRTLQQAGRGASVIKVQYSKDLGVSDLWTSHEAIVPGSAGTTTVNGVTFVVSTVAGGFLDVQATVPASAASPGTKLFSRIRVDP